jgi:DNA-binding CsgD family transcriptional regulator
MDARRGSTRTRAHSLTLRQNQVIHLVAAGMTNKEIGHLLGITQRGVSAQISRMLSYFSVTNRAELVARALVEQRGQGRAETAAAAPVGPELENQLLAYRDSPFIVVLTIGEAHTVWYVNRAAERALGTKYARDVGRPLQECLSGRSVAWWQEAAARTLRTGLPASVVVKGTQSTRDDQSSDTGELTCVFQPVLRNGTVVAVLTICLNTPPDQR